MPGSSLSLPSLAVTSAFAVPIVETVMPNCEGVNSRLRELFLEWEHDAGRIRTSVPTAVIKVGVYESDFSLFSNPEPEIQVLKLFCLNTLGYVIAKLNQHSDDYMRRLRIYQHSWYHLTRHAGYTVQHNHPMASWSGVYCVDPGDELPLSANSGALRFLDTRGSAGMYLDPGNAHLEPPFVSGARAFFLAPGQLILFPSYLMHEVSPYLGRRERITVAFNAWVREAGEAVDTPFVRTQ